MMNKTIRPQAYLIGRRPVEGSIQAIKEIWAYRGHRYSVFYHPLYQCYQVGVAVYDKHGYGLLGRYWRDMLTDHAPTLEAAHQKAQAEIDRVIRASPQP